jgi:hypothetical protein
MQMADDREESLVSGSLSLATLSKTAIAIERYTAGAGADGVRVGLGGLEDEALESESLTVVARHWGPMSTILDKELVDDVEVPRNVLRRLLLLPLRLLQLCIPEMLGMTRWARTKRQRRGSVKGRAGATGHLGPELILKLGEHGVPTGRTGIRTTGIRVRGGEERGTKLVHANRGLQLTRVLIRGLLLILLLLLLERTIESRRVR